MWSMYIKWLVSSWLMVQATDYMMTDETAELLNQIHSKVLLMSLDVGLMDNNLMKKAVTYLLNQWKTLKNYIEDGRVEISNNLCEQRMKAVKLNLSAISCHAIIRHVNYPR